MVVIVFMGLFVIWVASLSYAVYKATVKKFKKAAAGMIVAIVPTYFITFTDYFYAAFFKWFDALPPGFGIF